MWENKRAMMAPDCSPDSVSPQNEFYLLCPIVPTVDPRDGATFDPRGIIWTNLVEIHKESYIQNIKALGLPVSEKNSEISFLCFYVQICDPPGRGQFWPQGHHMNKLGRGPHKEMLYTKYESTRPSSLREEEFWILPSLFLCSNLWPQGWGQSWPQGHHMKNPSTSPQGSAACQISMLYANKFQRKKKFEVCLICSCFNLWPPPPPRPAGRDQFWPQGHHMYKLGRCPQWDAIYQIWKL